MYWAFDICLKNRKILASFLNDFSVDELNKIPKGFNNNIFWNISHIVVTQQLLVYGLSDLPMLVSKDLVDKYRKGSKPSIKVNQEEVDKIKELLFSTLKKTKEDYENGVFKNFEPYTTSTNSTITNVEKAIEFNNFHEGIHLGYILAMKKSF